jgi:hypothetical protein
MQRRAVTLCLFAMLVLVPVLRAADTLPAAISDAAFWKMISDFSEPGGTFDFEMYMSNEVTFQEILPDLFKAALPEVSISGSGPSRTSLTFPLFCRGSPLSSISAARTLLEMLMYKALFEASPNRAAFVSSLFSRKLTSTVDLRAPVETVFNALDRKTDPQLFTQNLQNIKDRLVKTHGFVLSAQDLRTIDYIYSVFSRGGPDASLTSFGTSYRALMRYTDPRGETGTFWRMKPIFSLSGRCTGRISSFH